MKKKQKRKTETIGFRIDPKLRFHAELIARKHRRSFSNFIEFVVSEYAEKSDIFIGDIWDVDEDKRLGNLKNKYPELLTYEEEILCQRKR